MPTFVHDGVRFHYERRGSGPPVIMCHGLTGDSESVKPLVADLHGREAITFDFRGHGRTEPVGNREAFTFRGFANDLHAIADGLGLKEAVIAGVSMGAGVAVRFALEWPRFVTGLILIRPAWLDVPSPEPLRLYERAGDLLESVSPAEARRRLTSDTLWSEVNRADAHTASSAIQLFDDPLAVDRRWRLQGIPRDCPISGWREVEGLSVPALVIGSDDYVHPLSYAQEWARRVPRAAFVTAPSKITDPQGYTVAVRSAIDKFLTALPKE